MPSSRAIAECAIVSTREWRHLVLRERAAARTCTIFIRGSAVLPTGYGSAYAMHFLPSVFDKLQRLTLYSYPHSMPVKACSNVPVGGSVTSRNIPCTQLNDATYIHVDQALSHLL